ncbi:methyl-accepting chemotaxis sensory transducer [Candidatus Moduliflexus flocculans]|uniref:Methyl-accepting chemotaxis sensory transducer n=1 Tax=Candidatus Moduliflexus flocculans TaxID=1499966 RepID=A0A081BQX0_9BACT|nr:methyl-accepting chemotaxis sensory transducer [Candidatus Moduliflexus flocculans]
MRLHSITYKMMVWFGLAAIVSILMVGIVVSVNITNNVSRQSQRLMADMTDQINTSLNLPHQTIELLLHEEIQRDMHELFLSSTLAKNIERKQIKAVESELYRTAEILGVDYILLIDLERRITASYPTSIDELAVEKYLATWEFGKKALESLLNTSQNQSVTIIDSLTWHDTAALTAFELQQRDIAEKGALAIAAAGIIKNDFDEPLSIAIAGRLLNNYVRPLQRLADLAGYDSIIYLDSTPISFAGFSVNEAEAEGSVFAVPAELQTAVYQSSGKVNQILTLAGMQYLTACSALRTFSRAPVGMLCVGIPETRIGQIQENVRSCGVEMRRNVQYWLIGIGGTAIVLFMLLSWGIARKIVTPLARLSTVTQQIASGDLRQTIPVTSRDEIGRLSQAVNEMLGQVSGVIHQVRDVADRVALESLHIHANVQEMVQSVNAQSASAEEIASSLEEMTINITHNSHNALQTAQLALQSAEDAQETEEAVQRMIEAIYEIAKRVSVIQDIAAQTRLLSLNATIQAAHVTEFGKGFSVVANEVRDLAERAQFMAEEINLLAMTNVQIAEHAAEKLTTLMPDIQKTMEFIQEVHAASREQKNGSDYISNAMQELNQAISASAISAASVETATKTLADQAAQLHETVGFFKINDA